MLDANRYKPLPDESNHSREGKLTLSTDNPRDIVLLIDKELDDQFWEIWDKGETDDQGRGWCGGSLLFVRFAPPEAAARLI